MAFNRDIWLKPKARKPCPTCLIGILEPPQNENILQNETIDSSYKNSFGQQSHSEYIVSMHLKCNSCNEVVAFTCLMTEENDPSEEELGLQKFVKPISYYPAPKIIEIPKSCPKGVKEVLDESFGLFWLDLGSCANKIRTSVEVLLNEFTVPTTMTTEKGGITRLSLHGRLKLFEQTNLDAAKRLEAIKYIGNVGSHYSEVREGDILDAYELLEFSLEKLFNDREQKINLITQKINQRQKPGQNL